MSPDRDSSFMCYVDSFPLSDGKNNLGYISIVIRDCISINNVFLYIFNTINNKKPLLICQILNSIFIYKSRKRDYFE